MIMVEKERGRLGDTDITGEKAALFCWDRGRNLAAYETEVNTRNMASVYTQLNLDNRLYHVKDGYWDIKIK